MKKFFMLLALAASAGIYLNASPELTWNRRNDEKCKQEKAKYDDKSFKKCLSPYSSRLYKDFTSEQKKKAMDYANKNNMTPDEAVGKVADNS